MIVVQALIFFNIAVFCPEEEIPKFKEGTVAGTTNYLDLKAASPDYWNMYKKRITYTCPVGYVIEKPGNVYNEQPDPIPEELETFEVECAANAVWTPRPKDGGNYMPYCIRKCSVHLFCSVRKTMNKKC